MKVLVIGNGGREHAIADSLAHDSRVSAVYVAPGNGGTSDVGKNIPLHPTDVAGLATFADKNRIDLTVVGPEDSLALGIVTAFQARHLRIFGPTAAAARIESSKAFAKQSMLIAGIPTASYRRYENCGDAGMDFTNTLPFVIKDSGLAQGKGSFICRTVEDMERALSVIAERNRGKNPIVIVEEYLTGNELSVHVLCDGKTTLTLPAVRDHKPLYLNPDGTEGPNTGGMGAYSPVADATPELMERVASTVVNPVLNRLTVDGSPFRGCLYPGLKVLSNGKIKVLEFNARFGDPEMQIITRQLMTPLLDLLIATTDGTLHLQSPIWDSRPCYCLVIAARGYPGEYKQGMRIDGIIEAEQVARRIKIFHAGTMRDGNALYVSRGRVLSITGDSPDDVYAAAKAITFDGGREEVYYRKDLFRSL